MFPWNEIRMPKVPDDVEILRLVINEFENNEKVYPLHLGRDWSNQTRVQLALRNKIRPLCRKLKELGIIEMWDQDHNPDTAYRALTEYGREVIDDWSVEHLIFWH